MTTEQNHARFAALTDPRIMGETFKNWTILAIKAHRPGLYTMNGSDASWQEGGPIPEPYSRQIEYGPVQVHPGRRPMQTVRFLGVRAGRGLIATQIGDAGSGYPNHGYLEGPEEEYTAMLEGARGRPGFRLYIADE